MSGTGTAPPHPLQEDGLSQAGHELQGLIRSLEKSHNQNDDVVVLGHDKAVCDLIRLLHDLLIPSIARRGLLLGDQDKAKQLYSMMDRAGTLGDGTGGKNKKQQQQRTLNNQLLTIYQDTDSEAPTTKTTGYTLILPNLVRILGGQQQQQSQKSEETGSKLLMGLKNKNDQFLLILLTADLVTAISEAIKRQNPQSSSCAAVEFEMVSSHAKPLLIGLTRSMDHILSCYVDDDIQRGRTFCLLTRQQQMQHQQSMSEMAMAALQSSHRAAASLIGLLGTRLSRHATAVLEPLAAVGVWETLSSWGSRNDPSLVQSATVLYSALLLAGKTSQNNNNNMNNNKSSSPLDLSWNVCWRETVAMLFVLLQSVIPNIHPGLAERAYAQETWFKANANSRKETLNSWLQSIAVTDDKEERAIMFLHHVQILVSMLANLLSQPAMGGFQQSHQLIFLGAELDIVTLLDLVEILMSLPVSAESVYFGTKKRLRQELMESGRFSPVAVTKMANHAKVMGHELLNVVLTCLKMPILLPFARRLLKTSYASLLASSSTALRLVLEGSSPPSSDRNRQRWLNSSIYVRTVTLLTAKQVLLTVGTEVNSARQKSTTLGVGNPGMVSDTDRWVTLVCGCTIEQLQSIAGTQQQDQHGFKDWGSLQEQKDCLIASIECLSAFLVSNGPFLSNTARSLMDSVTKTVMSRCTSLLSASEKLEDMSLLYRAILDLGIQSCSTPWQDGGVCSLRLCLRTLAERLQRSHGSDGVLLAACAAIRFCDTVDTPRVPALTIVTRTTTAPARNGIATAEVMAQQLDEATMKLQDEIEKHLEEERVSKRRKIEANNQVMTKKESTKKLKDPPPAQPTQEISSNADTVATSTSEATVSAKEDGPKIFDNVDTRSSDTKKSAADIAAKASAIGSTDAEEPGEQKKLPHDSPAKRNDDEAGDSGDDDMDDIPIIFDAPPDEEDR